MLRVALVTIAVITAGIWSKEMMRKLGLKIPLETGVIQESDVLADFYDLAAGATGRTAIDDITVFKNGGGAHLDLITASAILNAIG